MPEENQFMPSFVADAIRWERVQLMIAGRIQNIDTSKVDFCLIDHENNKRVVLPHVAIQDGKFGIKINIITVYTDRTFLPDGKWAIAAVNRDTGVLFPMTTGESLFNDDGHYDQYVGLPNAEKIARFGRIYTKGTQYSYSLTPRMTDTGEIYLHSLYVHPPKRNVFYRFAKRLHSLFRPIRDYLLHRGFNVVFKLAKTFSKHDGTRILFTSDSRSELSGNMQNVYQRMVERGLDKQFRIDFMFKENVKARRGIKDKFRMPYLLGCADIIIIDDFNPTVKQCKFKKSVKVIQLWHACGAFKTVGFSRTGKTGGPFVTNNNHRVYTHAIASSKHVAQFYCEAFGMTEDMVYPTGVPRTDMFFDEKYKADVRKRMHEEIPQSVGKRVILFAPTFRGNGAKSGHYPLEKLNIFRIADMCRKTNSIFIFKLHPFVKDKVIIPKSCTDVILDCTEQREINDLLFITDIMITDYSSVIYEASILNIPMLFYAFDLDNYISTRDFYEPFRSFVPGKIVSTFEQLITAILKCDFEQEKVEPFCKRNFEYQDAGSTDRVIDWLILGKVPEDLRS